MSAAEIIEQIRALPQEEREQVVRFLREDAATNPGKGRKKSFEEASEEVFSEYGDLLAKLAK